MSLRLGIVGCGRAGRALALAIASSRGPIRLTALSSRNRRRARSLARRATGAPAVCTPEELPGFASVILLCVPDDVIPEMARRISRGGERGALRGCTLLHLSGALGTEGLAPARGAGAAVGSIHPLSPFPPASAPPPDLEGTWFVPGGQPRARRSARSIIRHLKGNELAVPEGSREAYHLAATLLANHTTILAGVAMEILERQGGLKGPRLRMAFSSLLRAAANNLEKAGPLEALTGPASRGDVTTMERHLDSLASEPPDLTLLYALLSERGVAMAARRGSLEKPRAARARRLLRSRRKAR